MRLASTLLFAPLFLLRSPLDPAASQDFASIRAEAEARYQEKSWSLAHELYQRAAGLELEPDQRRWVAFRLGDTGWRAAASTADPDPSDREQALQGLEALLREVERPEQRDDLWALVHESLGDAAWTERTQDWGTAGPHYQQALDWWAHSSDLERARRRYLDIVWRVSTPPWRERYWGGGYFPRFLGDDVLENALKIAVAPEDVDRARFLVARAWMDRGSEPRNVERIERDLGPLLESGKASEWYDDALFALAQYYERGGRTVVREDGQRESRPDLVRALELYRRITTEFRKGETRWYDGAASAIRNLTEPALTLGVERFFLPGSVVGYQLGWRNTARVELGLHPVDLTRHVSFSRPRDDDWLARLPLSGGETWSFETEDDGRHENAQRALELARKPAPGAYVLVARAGGVERRALVLVTDAALSLKATGKKVLVWATEVMGGKPIAEAEVRAYVRWHDGKDWRRRELQGRTAVDGTVAFDVDPSSTRHGQWLVTMKSGERQTLAGVSSPAAPTASTEWTVYAQTDRAAYRPGDLVQWSAWARKRLAGAYETPAGAALTWEILDPVGTVVAKGDETLNAFGALWGRLETTAAMTLGEYRVRFLDGAREENRAIGQATLFRLEEYKLPEFEVTVGTPDDPEHPGAPQLYVVGDRVEAEVKAEYYSGGAVGEATVEVFVFQRPRGWMPRRQREFPWFYDETPRMWWGGPGQQVLHETLRTDAEGRARVAFDTPFGSENDLEYTIEARVTDASRREIVGTGTVVVGQRTLRVELQVEHAIHRPGTEVDVSVAASDLNDNPLALEGLVRVTRERWIEVWRDPAGRDVTGSELRALRSGSTPFPPPGWTTKFRGYESEPVLETRVRTAADGQGALSFTPPSDGYYRVAWTGEDARGSTVTAETAVFVADDASRELGYLSGGVELLVDRDTVRTGEDCAVLLMVPSSGRFVLFTVEAEDLLHHEVVEMTGQVKLLHLPITATHVPNVMLGALSVFGGEAFSDSEELIVPPVEQFLDVAVRAPAEDVEPGSEGAFTIEVRDHAGRPVETIVTLAVIDEAIAYIQQDYAGDPRRFFHGQKRPLRVTTGGSFDMGRFRREDEDRRTAQREELGEDGYRLGLGREAGESGTEGWFLGQGEKRMMRQAAKAAVSGPSTPGAPQELYMADEAAARGGGAGPGGPAVRVRSDFRSTALWVPDVTTDTSGRASVKLRYPDSTTRWRALARACDVATRVGEGTARVRARLPLTARLQAPRFFVVGDTATLSGVLQNDTDAPLTATATLEVEGLARLGVLVGDAWTTGDSPPVVVPAHGQARVDWRMAAKGAGEARVQLSVLSGDLGDALERRYPVEEHGLDAFVGVAGRTDGSGVAFDLDLPAERRTDSTVLEVTVAPSLAVTMLDALPYLIDYPYGCVEQTLSRFVPAAIVARTLREQGLSPEQAMQRVFGGVEGEYAARTHPKGQRSLDLLDEMSRAGLERLYDFQHDDGSWAWWKEGDGDAYMTAYVLWGLALARDAGLDVRAGVVENGVRWLTLELVEAETRPDLAVWLLHAVAVSGSPGLSAEQIGYRDRAFERLWNDRERLNAYGRALLALSAHALGRADATRVLVDNLQSGVKLDESPDTSIVQVGAQTHRPFTQATAHWGPDRAGRRWYESPVETTAFVLRALVALDPRDSLIGPTMNWLVKNRRGAQWSNTRDTAITVLALSDYLAASGELAGAAGWRVSVNGTVVDERSLSPDELLGAPPVVRVDRELLRDGANRIEIVRTAGEGPLYFAARATFFSLEDPIPSRGSEVFVRREYWRLAARPTLLAGTVYDRVLLTDGDTVSSGERVEVVLSFEAKNELEYLVFEDDKPAGLEAVSVRSGEPIQARELKSREASARFGADDAEAERRRAGPDRGPQVEVRVGDGYTGRSRGAHQELRDRRVAFFLDRLPQGTWELRYDLRAEVPGRFHALPTRAHAMYVPEIRANGEEVRLTVDDR